ncbi:MAG TPA: chromosomal replication initiator protein DnaA [Candidatus Hydrogenedentes bacterium]|jgi:chromosomal replication initiator protein|nr:chromosomal replication initiator protein DnaA [Candidatus Hydrogenedentota bacterium]
MAPKETNPWALAQERLKEILDEHSYKNWFSQTYFLSCEGGCLLVGVPSQFFADWLKGHYMDTISDTLRALMPDFTEVQFVPSPDVPRDSMQASPWPEAHRPQEPRPAPARTASRAGIFDPRYTFERFVVGADNRFAHAAAKAVAERPARAYNPLFLYGGTGLGKTHLMQAIGHELLKRDPQTTVTFISSEDFTNQLIESIAKKSTVRFRAKYRKTDVLLIDDIHFIAGKEATQEEFFHTFNALFDMRKQIVISSDRPPKEIPGLEERLISRFEWGLVTDIQPPDLETRVAILQNKAAEEKHPMPPELLRYIATCVTSNIRELEGALITVLAYSHLTEQPITMPVVEEVLRDLIGRDKIQPITVEAVQRAVAEYFDVRIADLRGRSRQRKVAYPRQIAMYMCKELIPSLSLNEIGEDFGGKDHTTVLYACQKIAAEKENKKETRDLLQRLEKRVRNMAS